MANRVLNARSRARVEDFQQRVGSELGDAIKLVATCSNWRCTKRREPKFGAAPHNHTPTQLALVHEWTSAHIEDRAMNYRTVKERKLWMAHERKRRNGS
jgi:hypothetical protein